MQKEPLINKKKEAVAQMFDDIAPKYDFLNHFLSLNIDKLWRKKLIKLLKKEHPVNILDVATGTGDLAIASLKAGPEKVTGIDISIKMIEVGLRKIKEKQLEDKIELLLADSLEIPFKDNSFDAVMVAFGVRNFENLEKGLLEMKRVIKPGKKAFILEFSKPERFPVKQVYNLYFHYILPFFGKRISKNSKAYSYLPDTVEKFPEASKFTDIMTKCGYSNANFKRLSFGIATIYTGEKNNS
jgi:demethylmenaquinone methyltransferase/2-methoxy-6-polyprenyl-1,4-benzoquinol methylase